MKIDILINEQYETRLEWFKPNYFFPVKFDLRTFKNMSFVTKITIPQFEFENVYKQYWRGGFFQYFVFDSSITTSTLVSNIFRQVIDSKSTNLIQ